MALLTSFPGFCHFSVSPQSLTYLEENKKITKCKKKERRINGRTFAEADSGMNVNPCLLTFMALVSAGRNLRLSIEGRRLVRVGPGRMEKEQEDWGAESLFSYFQM